MKLKKIVSAALAGAMLASTALIGVTAAETNTLPFTDVNAKDWFYGAVQEAYDEGIMTGKSDTVFDPKANITRAEVVTAFARVACTNIEGKGDNLTFTDTKSGKWYSDAVGWAADNGIVKGRGDGRFSPSDNITRAELASIIINFVKYMELKLPDNPKIDKFSDADSFDGWMKEPVEAVRKTGLMQGVGGMFNPTGTATRGEIAEVVKNLLPGVGRNVVVEDGKSDYVIVIDEENAAAKDASDRMVWQIEEVCGVTMKVVDDGTAETAKEIVLGETSRGNKIDTSTFVNDSYEIAVDSGKVYIGGATAEGIYKGAVNFMNTCTSGDDVRFTAKSAEVDLFEYPIGKLTINGNDISKYTVLYPAGASENTMTGVNDLVEYIEKACGVKLEAKEGTSGDFAIIVKEEVVPVKDSPNKGVENFSVKSEGNNIVITGAADRGAMYGCYDFLEDVLGWIFLTETQDYLSPVDELDIKGLDYTEAPVFEHRVNLCSTYLEANELGNWVDITEMTSKHKLWQKAWVKNLNNCHTFDALTYGEYPQATQPCLSNKEVCDKILANAMTYLKNDPDAELISISQNDNIVYCKCDDCMETYKKYSTDPNNPESGGTAGQMLEFVNKIAAEIGKEYPDVTIHTFAYTYTQTAPKNIKPAENVMVQLCSITACFNHGLDYDKSSCNKTFHDDMENWADVAHNIYIWDYENNFSFRGTPFPNLTYDVLAENMQFFANNNVKGMFSQGNDVTNSNGEFDRLRWYLLAKLLWDPYMSEAEYDAHIAKFMEGFYGEGWENVLKAMNLFHENFDIQCVYLYQSITENWMMMYLDKYIEELVSLMDEAKFDAESKVVFENIDASQIQYDFLYLSINFNTWYNSSDETLRQMATDLSFELMGKMQKYKMNMSERYPAPELTEITKPPYEWKDLMDEQMFGESAE